MKNTSSDIIIYQSQDGNISVDVLLKDENIWLSQLQICELFGKAKGTISEHILNIFLERELDEKRTVRKFRTVQVEGTREVERDIVYYSLDVIISVGYRVKSAQGTRFRQWATQRLKEYLTQGFTLNEEKLKSGKSTEYFDKLQAKLREIRLSERVFYQKIKDIYTTSVDYDPKDKKTIAFFKVVQNKLLWAISQSTAAELIHRRSDCALPFMGMESFDKKDKKSITKKDVSIAKIISMKKKLKHLVCW